MGSSFPELYSFVMFPGARRCWRNNGSGLPMIRLRSAARIRAACGFLTVH